MAFNITVSKYINQTPVLILSLPGLATKPDTQKMSVMIYDANDPSKDPYINPDNEMGANQVMTNGRGGDTFSNALGLITFSKKDTSFVLLGYGYALQSNDLKTLTVGRKYRAYAIYSPNTNNLGYFSDIFYLDTAPTKPKIEIPASNKISAQGIISLTGSTDTTPSADLQYSIDNQNWKKPDHGSSAYFNDNLESPNDSIFKNYNGGEFIINPYVKDANFTVKGDSKKVYVGQELQPNITNNILNNTILTNSQLIINPSQIDQLPIKYGTENIDISIQNKNDNSIKKLKSYSRSYPNDQSITYNFYQDFINQFPGVKSFNIIITYSWEYNASHKLTKQNIINDIILSDFSITPNIIQADNDNILYQARKEGFPVFEDNIIFSIIGKNLPLGQNEKATLNFNYTVGEDPQAINLSNSILIGKNETIQITFFNYNFIKSGIINISYKLLYKNSVLLEGLLGKVRLFNNDDTLQYNITGQDINILENDKENSFSYAIKFVLNANDYYQINNIELVKDELVNLINSVNYNIDINTASLTWILNYKMQNTINANKTYSCISNQITNEDSNIINSATFNNNNQIDANASINFLVQLKYKEIFTGITESTKIKTCKNLITTSKNLTLNSFCVPTTPKNLFFSK